MSSKLPQRKILLSACVLSDGVGDFYHLLDLAKNKKLMPNYTKDVFISVGHTDPTLLKMMKEQLENAGFKVINISHGRDIPDNISELGNTAFISSKFRNEDIVHESILTRLDGTYSGNITISADIRHPFSMPKLFIKEHEGRSMPLLPQRDSSQTIQMNLLSGTRSLFFTEETRESPSKQLSEILTKNENHELRSALLGTKTTESKGDTEACETFLKQNLFIPCYFQHNNAAIINFMNIASLSPLSKDYPSICFFVNNVDTKSLEKALKLGLFSKKIKKIIIRTKDGEKEFINPNADQDARDLKLVSGFRVKDDKDYNDLFHCAQYFAGCSGDKTFEKTLSNGLVPFFIPHNMGKTSFLQDSVKFNRLFENVLQMGNLNDLLQTGLDADFRTLQDAEEILSKLKIPESEFPDIIKKWKSTTLTGKPFEHDGVTYEAHYSEKIKNKLVDAFLEMLLDETGKKLSDEESKEFIEKFINSATDENPEILKEFLKKNAIEDGSELFAIANNVAEAIKNNKPIKLNRVKYKCEFSPDVTKRLEILLQHEIFSIIAKHMESALAPISQSMDSNYFKKWSELCEDLQKNHNLHQLLPSIAHNFFQQYLENVAEIQPQKAPVPFTPAADAASAKGKTYVVSSDSEQGFKPTEGIKPKNH